MSLSNYMAYLDSFIQKFESFVFRFSHAKSAYGRNLNEYTQVLCESVSISNVFGSHEKRILSNVISKKPRVLDN